MATTSTHVDRDPVRPGHAARGVPGGNRLRFRQNATRFRAVGLLVGIALEGLRVSGLAWFLSTCVEVGVAIAVLRLIQATIGVVPHGAGSRVQPHSSILARVVRPLLHVAHGGVR